MPYWKHHPARRQDSAIEHLRITPPPYTGPMIEKSDSIPDLYVLRGQWTDIAGTASQWRAVLQAMLARSRMQFQDVSVHYLNIGACLSRWPEHPRDRKESDFALVLDTDIRAFVTAAEGVLATD